MVIGIWRQHLKRSEENRLRDQLRLSLSNPLLQEIVFLCLFLLESMGVF